MCVCVRAHKCRENIKQILNKGLLDLGDFIFFTFYKSLTMRLKDFNMNDCREDFYFFESHAHSTLQKERF